MEPKFSVSVRFGSGSRFFRFDPRFSVFCAQGDLGPQANDHACEIGAPGLFNSRAFFLVLHPSASMCVVFAKRIWVLAWLTKPAGLRILFARPMSWGKVSWG